MARQIEDVSVKWPKYDITAVITSAVWQTHQNRADCTVLYCCVDLHSHFAQNWHTVDWGTVIWNLHIRQWLLTGTTTRWTVRDRSTNCWGSTPRHPDCWKMHTFQCKFEQFSRSTTLQDSSSEPPLGRRRDRGVAPIGPGQAMARPLDMIGRARGQVGHWYLFMTLAVSVFRWLKFQADCYLLIYSWRIALFLQTQLPVSKRFM